VPVGPAFGTFGKNVETTVPVFGAIATGDMNRDGLADLGSNVESLYEIKRLLLSYDRCSVVLYALSKN